MTTTDNLYPTTDKEAVPALLLQELAMEHSLIHDLEKYHRVQLLAQSILVLAFCGFLCLLFLNAPRDLLFFCAGILVLLTIISFCITHLYHEAVQNKERYARALKRLNSHSRTRSRSN